MSTLSSTETGNANQVANLSLLGDKVEALGPVYAPSAPELAPAALRYVLMLAETSLEAVRDDETALIEKTNERQEEYAQARLFATRAINALEGCRAPKSLLDDARRLNRKFYGGHAPKKKAKDGDLSGTGTVTTKVVAQMGYDQRGQQFAKIVSLIATFPAYLPNEPELSISALKSHSAYLIQLNKDIDVISTRLGNSRATCNELLYGPVSGIYDLSKAVKKYVRSVLGGSSPRFIAIRRIKFYSR